MTLFIKKKKSLSLVGLVKDYIYIYKEHFLINSLIHLKWNSLMRKILCEGQLILIHNFTNILENKLYITYHYKIIIYSYTLHDVTTS